MSMSAAALAQQNGQQQQQMPEEGNPPTTQVVQLTFEKGLDQSQEDSVLPIGFLTECKNWVPEPTGSLRARRSWSQGPNTRRGSDSDNHGQPWPTRKRFRGLEYIPISQGPVGKWFLGAIKNPDAPGDAPQIWATQSDLGSGWVHIDTLEPGDHGDVDLDEFPVAFAKGVGAALWTHPKLAKVRKWAGGILPASPSSIDATDDRAGMALAFHKNRYFMGGSDAFPYKLFFSKLGEVDDWDDTGSTDLKDPSNNNFIDVGKDDSEHIRDLASFQNLLFIGKESNVFVLSGSGLDTFNLRKLEGAQCGLGRTLVPTPKGLVILGDTGAWLWDGGNPEPISPAVETEYVKGAGLWRTARYVNGKVYVVAQANAHQTLVFDIINGVWSTETTSTPDENGASLAVHTNQLVMGPWNGQEGLYARLEPGGERLLDEGLTPKFEARTAAFTVADGEGLIRPVTVRHLYVSIRQRAGSHVSSGLQVKLFVDDGALAVKTIDLIDEPSDGFPQVITKKLGFGKNATGNRLQFLFTADTDTGVFDIEECQLEFQILGRR